MKQLLTLLFLSFNVVLFSQKKQVDTLIILGHKYPLERTNVYYTQNEEVSSPVIRCQHQRKLNMLEIELFKRTGYKQDTFLPSGYQTTTEFSQGKEKFKYRLYAFADSIKLDDKGLINLKSAGQLNLVNYAEFILSNDTSTYFISIPGGKGSEGVFQILSWELKRLKPTSIFLTALYYTDKFKNVNYLPIQFCLLTN